MINAVGFGVLVLVGIALVYVAAGLVAGGIAWVFSGIG